MEENIVPVVLDNGILFPTFLNHPLGLFLPSVEPGSVVCVGKSQIGVGSNGGKKGVYMKCGWFHERKGIYSIMKV